MDFHDIKESWTMSNGLSAAIVTGFMACLRSVTYCSSRVAPGAEHEAFPGVEQIESVGQLHAASIAFSAVHSLGAGLRSHSSGILHWFTMICPGTFSRLKRRLLELGLDCLE
jgi:hypothetical protein